MYNQMKCGILCVGYIMYADAGVIFPLLCGHATTVTEQEEEGERALHSGD